MPLDCEYIPEGERILFFERVIMCYSAFVENKYRSSLEKGADLFKVVTCIDWYKKQALQYCVEFAANHPKFVIPSGIGDTFWVLITRLQNALTKHAA